jgi:hypothetical protein
MGVFPECGGGNGGILGIKVLKVTQPYPKKRKIMDENKGILPDLEPSF